jgi:hypothetical protein
MPIVDGDFDDDDGMMNKRRKTMNTMRMMMRMKMMNSIDANYVSDLNQ